MKTTPLLLSLVASAAAYPAGKGLFRRAGCDLGALVCNGSTRFAICNHDGATAWMRVSDGTKCVCSGGSCGIEAADAPEESTPLPAPGASTTVVTMRTTQTQTLTRIQPWTWTSTTSTSASSSASTWTPTAQPTPAPPLDTTPFQTNPGTAPEPAQNPGPSPGPGPKAPPALSPGKSYLGTFSGTGDPSQGWPRQSQWVDFESMWTANLADTIHNSCTAFDQPNNSDEENAALRSAIQSVARSSGVDPRFVLAILMQESAGCVRAPTTANGVTNPGLMQSHNGAHSCYGVNPCPGDQILGMVKDGTTGTSSGYGLEQILAEAGDGDARYYRAARMYNSGSVAASGLLQDGIATRCYASDVANRLLGWSEGVGTCTYR